MQRRARATDDDGNEQLYGEWQTEPWSPPPVGPTEEIPKNEYKNIVPHVILSVAKDLREGVGFFAALRMTDVRTLNDGSPNMKPEKARDAAA